MEEAVREAELKTRAEIVPVVAASSAAHRRGEDLAAVWLTFLVLLALAIFSPEHQIDGLEAVVAYVLALAAGSFIAGRIPAVKRLFVPRLELDQAVADGALRTFRTFGVGETAGRTGLLIYVSLFERGAVVLGDSALSPVLGAADYAAIRDVLLEGLRRGRIEEALLAAVRKAGELLSAKLPRAADDRPEIPDTLRILD